MTLDLFSDAQFSSDASTAIDLPGGDIVLFDKLFSDAESDAYLSALTSGAEIDWRQEKISLYGKAHNLPRLTAWYGDPDKSYTYSGIRVDAMPWTRSLLAIKARIEKASGELFNSVLLNQYRDGSDGVSWHSDDEPELGSAPIIASVSFGQVRKFQLKHKADARLKHSIELGHGSFLLMKGDTQKNWLHQVPKSMSKRNPMGMRINLTFRIVESPCTH
jgi:alkylated DNA repair dioxygenase AlkB